MSFSKSNHFIAVLLTTAVIAANPAIAGPGGAGHGHTEAYSAGIPGDPAKPARIVPITVRETDDGKMIYTPDKLSVKKGEQVRFVITNAGAIPHEFVLATAAENLKHAEMMQKFPEMEHDDANSKSIEPQGKAEIVWRFSESGTYEFSCLIPGHREAGMIGNIVVQ